MDHSSIRDPKFLLRISAFSSLPPPLSRDNFHHADSAGVSIAFHRRRGRGETSVHASNLIRLVEIYICVHRHPPLLALIPLPLRSPPAPTHFPPDLAAAQPGLLEFISGTVDNPATPKLLDIPRAPISARGEETATLIYLPDDRLYTRDARYWSIFGVERGQPEFIALFAAGFTSDDRSPLSFPEK